MGILYCLFMKIDFTTGTTPELSHKDLGADMGGLGFKAVSAAIGRLRKAGIIRYADFRGRGVKWSDGSGHANRYQMAFPPIDPVQNLDRGVSKKEPAPPPKNVHHYNNPSLSDGADAAASRGEGDKVPLIPDTDRGGERVPFGELMRRHGYPRAREIEREWLAANVAAE